MGLELEHWRRNKGGGGFLDPCKSKTGAFAELLKRQRYYQSKLDNPVPENRDGDNGHRETPITVGEKPPTCRFARIPLPPKNN